jgi:hypothetical protein
MVMKGYWNVFEAMLAGTIMLVFIIAIAGRSMPEVSGPNAMVLRGYEALGDMDRAGNLRQYAASYDAAGLDSALAIPEYNHTIIICNQSSCTGSRPEASNVWTAGYVLAGCGVYGPVEVRLYLW